MPKRIAIDLGAGKQQRPSAVIEGYRANDLVVAVSSPPGATDKAANTQAIPALTLKDAGTVEAEYWESIKDSTDATDFQEYLKEYPQGRYALLARVKLRQLEAVTIVPAEKFGTITPLPTKMNWAITSVVGAFTIALYSCKMSGGDVICEFTVSNNSADNREFSLGHDDYRARRRDLDMTKAIDASGNAYRAAESFLGANRLKSSMYNKATLGAFKTIYQI